MVAKKSGIKSVAMPVKLAPDTSTIALPIIGIGASAGGLEAFESFFGACPSDTGMAFVLVPHLDPGHQSLLTEILQRSTAMPVVEALDQIVVAPNHVYVIPPNREMAIFNGVLQLSVPEQARGQRMPIDAFLRSLAEDQAENSVGVILSGTATDGTLGLRAILGAGGVCMVQEPSTAKYDGMPESAIAAGYATHVLPVAEMPAALLVLTRTQAQRQKSEHVSTPERVGGLNQILLQVRSVTGHDFSLYKKSTIGRRIDRRMAQHNIENLLIYARYLKEHPAEVQLLFKELLINVTSFFRDPEAFALLRNEILPQLLTDKPDGYMIRVWVAGCATGEEAYSIAILLREYMDETHKDFNIQIYATDLDDDAIAVARGGSYPPNIAQDVTPERLRRFFTKSDAGYKIRKDIREMLVFAVQNVIKDPPFTRLNLLSCRNLMIYLEPEQQYRLIPNFHYALKPGGVLFLSTSESITSHPELFPVINRKWKFYRASHSVAASHLPAPSKLPPMARIDTGGRPAKTKSGANDVADLSNRVLLQTYAPASVTTDIKGDIVYVHGDTGPYLRPPPGPVTTNVIEMAREGLQLELRTVFRQMVEVESVQSREVLVKTNGSFVTVSFSVRPLPTHSAGEKLLLVSFQDVVETTKLTVRRRRTKGGTAETETAHIEQLEHELSYVKENLQANIEEQQATNEELKSTNEELQSTNEELQSSNEELETSKEEMQSLNEETITMNAELHARIEQLNGIQNDMKNLLDNISTGTLFLDNHLIIRRYTSEVVKVYRLIANIGRPLSDIKSNIVDDDLQADLQGVLDTLIPCEREVLTTEGAWYLLRIQPYRTLDNAISGVVMSFTEVTEFKRASDKVKRSEALLTVAQEMARLGSWEMDVPSGRTHWSAEMFRLFDHPVVTTPMSDKDMLNRLEDGDRQRLAAAIKSTIDSGTPCDIGYRIVHPDGTTRAARSRAAAITDAKGRVTRLVGITMELP